MKNNLSHTAMILETAELFGNTPAEAIMGFEAPTHEDTCALIERVLDSVVTLCADTCNELDAQDLLWNVVNVFHRRAQKIERDADAKSQQLKTLCEQQDGSEIASYELEQATSEAHSLERRLSGLEAMREASAQYFEETTGDAWTPRTGSRASTKGAVMTAGMYDAKEIRQQRARKKAEILMPDGKKIIVTGGDCADYNRIYDYMDRVKATYDEKGEPIVILHCGKDSGVDKIIATWASNRNIPQVAFKPEWNKYNKSAGFKRNDAMLAECPDRVIVINSNTGVTDNLIDKARKAGIQTAAINEQVQQQPEQLAA